MASWARQRKTLYGGAIALIAVALIGFFAWKIFYKAPSCFDGLRNGDEQGVDCGGSCQKLCQSAFLPPVNNWTRFEEIVPGLYNVAAYIVNPNTKGEAKNVPYHVELYDEKGLIIIAYDDTVTLPPNRNVLAFKSAINVGSRIPAKAIFQFTSPPNWQLRDDGLASVNVTDKNYTEDSTGSSLSVTMKNTSVEAVGHMGVYAILYDKNQNTIGFSKTEIDGIDAGGTATAPFTWPTSHNSAVISIEVLPVAE